MFLFVFVNRVVNGIPRERSFERFGKRQPRPTKPGADTRPVARQRGGGHSFVHWHCGRPHFRVSSEKHRPGKKWVFLTYES